ncbi:MAG: hypothetical protein ACOYZ6_07660 [Chloroflexota bacterium]
MEYLLQLFKQLTFLFAIPALICALLIHFFSALSRRVSPKPLFFTSILLVLLSLYSWGYVLLNRLDGSEALGVLLALFIFIPIPIALLILICFGTKNKITIYASIVAVKIPVLNFIDRWWTSQGFPEYFILTLFILSFVILAYLFFKVARKETFFVLTLIAWDMMITISCFLVERIYGILYAISFFLIIGNLVVPLFIAATHAKKSIVSLFYPEVNEDPEQQLIP